MVWNILLRGRWTLDHERQELIDSAKREIQQVELAATADVVEGCVIRQPKAYPVYDDAYQQHVDTIRRALDENYPYASPGGPQWHA